MFLSSALKIDKKILCCQYSTADMRQATRDNAEPPCKHPTTKIQLKNPGISIIIVVAVHLVSIRPSDCSRVSRGPFCGTDDVGLREREEDEEEDDEEEEMETSRGELGPRVLSADWQTPAYILHVRRGHIYWHLSIRSIVETYCALVCLLSCLPC